MEFHHLLFFLCVIPSIIGQEDAKTECKMTEKDFDDCTTKVTMFGNRNLIIPATDELLDQFCNDSFTALNCMRRYSRTCMGSFARTVSGIFGYDIRRLLKKRCRSPEARAEFMKHMKCGVPKERLEPLHKCVDNYIAQLQYTLENVKREDLVTSTCCTLHQLHQCIRTQTSALCDSVTGPETAAYFDEVMSHAIGEGVDYTCGIYKDLDACNKNMKQEIWQPLFKIGENAEKAGYKATFSSPFTVAVKIFAKLN